VARPFLGSRRRAKVRLSKEVKDSPKQSHPDRKSCPTIEQGFDPCYGKDKGLLGTAYG
jgi:hypothetical protein